MPSPQSSIAIRPEIMALRAFALVAVLTHHFFPARSPGGFAGLDVFFVISGFLVTEIVVRARERDGRFSIAAFLARRARRILPAATVVLAAILIGMVVFAPISEWRRIALEALSSALFVENWHLIASSLVYAGPDTATPLQHYWTLAVEVQFYLVWAAMLVLVLGRTGAPRRRAVTVAIAAVVGLSFAASVVWCAIDPSTGYLSTVTRIWELAAGGLLAITLRSVPRALVGVPLAAVGWAALVGTVLLFSTSMAWPGWLAVVPVAGAALVIAGGVSPDAPRPVRLVNDNVIVRTLADISYAVYLWHWPLLVFADRILGHAPGTAEKLALVATSLLLGWLTTVLVERPVRFGPLASSRPRTVLVAGLVATAVVTAPSAAVVATMQRVSDLYGATAVAESSFLCDGAEALTPGVDCVDGPYIGLRPDPLGDWEQISVLHGMGCAQGIDSAEVLSCDFGDPERAHRVALVGDSHAMKLWAPLQLLAEQQGWQLVTYLRSQCEFTAVSGDGDLSCQTWRAGVAERLNDDGPWDAVVTTGASALTGGSGFDAAFAGTWSPFVDAGTALVVVRDVPYLTQSVRDCIVDSLDDLSACDRPRAEALLEDALAKTAARAGIGVIDLTDRFCDASTCFSVIGGVITHRDGDHITDDFARTLAPTLGARLENLAPELFD